MEGLDPKDLSTIRPLIPQIKQGQWYALERTGKQGKQFYLLRSLAC